jgi:hypothetical protein
LTSGEVPVLVLVLVPVLAAVLVLRPAVGESAT